jgi:hypothetical protein
VGSGVSVTILIGVILFAVAFVGYVIFALERGGGIGY